MGSAHALRGEVIQVEVPGGSLAVEVFSSATEPVLVRLLTAEWSVGAGSAPAYPAEAAAAFRDAFDVLVTVRPVAGVDHAGSIMSPAGARASAGLITEAMPAEALS